MKRTYASRLCALVCAAVVCLQLAACSGSSTSMSTAPSAPASPPVPVQPTFTVHPKYFIGSVVYTPPGEGGSSITYPFGAVIGTTVSTTQSWNNNSMTGVSVGDNAVAFGNNFGGSTSTSVDMQDNKAIQVNYVFPPSNAVNHDYDQIWIFLGVVVNAFVDDLGNITWSLDFSQILNQGFAESGYPVTVGCVRLNSTIFSSPVCTSNTNFLSSVGITPADYPNILGADPFADPNASPTPDASRYVRIGSVNYFPDSAASPVTHSENNSTTATNSTTSTYSYSVSSSVSGSYDGVSLKNPDIFTWTSSSTQSNKTGSTDSIPLTLSLPSSPYSGPTTLFVYLDTIYKTLLFSFNQ
jgi:hypothetical protein